MKSLAVRLFFKFLLIKRFSTLFKKTIVLLSFSLTLLFNLACSRGKLDIKSNLDKNITGKTSFSSNQSKLKTTKSSASTLDCDSVNVSLHSFLSDGSIDPISLTSAPLNSDGSFSIPNPKGVGINFDNPYVQYILVVEGCNNKYFRPLTSFKNQNVTDGSTLLGLTSDFKIQNKVALNHLKRDSVEETITLFNKINGDNLTNSLDQLINDSNLSKIFSETLNIKPNILNDAPPSLITINYSENIHELSTSIFSVDYIHWNSKYEPAYLWTLDNTEMSNLNSFEYYSTKKSQGNHKLLLTIGTKDANGNLDLTKPTKTQELTFEVSNDFPALAPPITLDGLVNRNFATGSVTMLTGENKVNCESFQSLALTESALIPPVLPSQFDIKCTSPMSQTIPFTLTLGDGLKTIALWAIDNSGNISLTASSVNLSLDQTKPILNLNSMPPFIKGGSTLPISWSVSDATSGIQNVILEYSPDGINYFNLSNVTGLTYYNWNIPAINSFSARLRVTATDQAGNITQTTSNDFVIDSIPPSLAFTSPSINTKAQNDLSISGSCESGIPVNISGSGVVLPSTTICIANTFNQDIQFSSNDGIKNIVISQRDEAGNIESKNRDFIKDTTAPTLTYLAPATNSTAQFGLILTGTCEPDILINISGTGVASSSSTNCNSGFFNQSIIFSNMDGTKNIIISQMDSAGNTGTTNRNFIKDSTAPVLSFTNPEINAVAQTGLTIAGSCESGLIVNISGTGVASPSTTNCSSGSFNQPITFSANDGTKNIIISQTDSVGNSGSINRTFIKDTIEPTAPTLTRTSDQYSNSTLLTFSVTCTSDYAGIFISNSNSKPLSSDTGWQVCTSAMSTTVSMGDGTKTIYAWTKDAAGNVSASANSISMVLDQTVPTIAFLSSFSGPFKGGSNLNLQFSITELNITTLQVFSIDYSTDNGINWTNSGSMNSTNGPLNGSNFNYNFLLPIIDSNQFKLRISATDRTGNSSQIISVSFSVDSTAPVITSFQLADGNSNVALPNVKVAISATDNSNSIYQMQISESSTISSNWMTYNSSSNYSMSLTVGNKTVYAWVKDASGNISASSTYNINLDFGNPPVLAVSSPASGSNYSVGSAVPISWTCSSINGLDPISPISKIEYTIDDGATFCPITTNLTNANDTYSSWVLPATNCNSISTTNKSFRVMVSCKSAAGVVSNAFSQTFNTSGWSVFAGDPWYAVQGLNASNALVTPDSSFATGSVAGDLAGNIYYTYSNAIMKIDKSTGLVSKYAGSLTSSGCTIGTGVSLSSGTLNAPVILGLNTNQTSLLVLSCNKVISIDTINSTGTDWFSSTMANWTFTKDRWLVFYDTISNNTAKVWKVDLKTANNTKIWIAGTGSSCGTTASVGTDAKLSPLKCGSSADVVPMLLANSDASTIWLTSYSSPTNAFKIDISPSTSNYLISQVSTSWGSTSMQQCRGNDFDNYLYCRNWNAGRQINVFNPISGSWLTGGTIPFVNNDDNGFLGIGFSPTNLLAFYSLNAINIVTPVIGGTWTYTNIAGQPLSTMGNGGPISGVAFSQPMNIKYNSATNVLWVRNASGNLRRIDFANSNSNTYSTSTVMLATGNTDSNSGSFNLNIAGDHFSLIGSWVSWTRLTNFSLTNTLTNYLTQFMSRGSATTNVYPSTSGANPNTDTGNVKIPNLSSTFQNMVYHTNGKLYFAGKNSTSDIFIFSSNTSAINRIAGKTGVGGYINTDNGNLALGASLTNVQHLFEIPSGTYTGDLLIIDGNWLRRISITTESASPKIYDIFNLTTVTGYTNNSIFNDFIYDFSTQSNNTLGTGTIYYVNNSNVVHKIIPSLNLTGGTDSTYSFTGTTFSGTVQIAITPIGLLVLQPNKFRILKVTP